MNTILDVGEKIDYRDSVTLAFIYKKLGKENEANEIIHNCKKSLNYRLPEIISSQSNLRKNFLVYYLEYIGKYDLFNMYIKLSSLYLMSGDKNIALEYFSKSIDYGTINTNYDLLAKNPEFEDLTATPEFQAFYKQYLQEREVMRNKFRELEDRGELEL